MSLAPASAPARGAGHEVEGAARPSCRAAWRRSSSWRPGSPRSQRAGRRRVGAARRSSSSRSRSRTCRCRPAGRPGRTSAPITSYEAVGGVEQLQHRVAVARRLAPDHRAGRIEARVRRARVHLERVADDLVRAPQPVVDRAVGDVEVARLLGRVAVGRRHVAAELRERRLVVGGQRRAPCSRSCSRTATGSARSRCGSRCAALICCTPPTTRELTKSRTRCGLGRRERATAPR